MTAYARELAAADAETLDSIVESFDAEAALSAAEERIRDP